MPALKSTSRVSKTKVPQILPIFGTAVVLRLGKSAQLLILPPDDFSAKTVLAGNGLAPMIGLHHPKITSGARIKMVKKTPRKTNPVSRGEPLILQAARNDIKALIIMHTNAAKVINGYNPQRLRLKSNPIISHDTICALALALPHATAEVMNKMKCNTVYAAMKPISKTFAGRCEVFLASMTGERDILPKRSILGWECDVS